MSYDVYISYRKDVGESTARAICDKLSEMGYKVFFDSGSSRAGQFDTKIFSVIEESKDFICVLSPNALDNCETEDDWMQQEIEYALKTRKNIIPILLKDFHFPEKLPLNIEEIRYQNGLEFSAEFFDAFIIRLTDFLTKKPLALHRIKQNSILRKVPRPMIALIIIAILIIAGNVTYNYLKHNFPITRADKNIVKEVIDYTFDNLQQENIGMDNYAKALKEMDTFLSNNSASENDKKVLLNDLKKYQTSINDAKSKLTDVPPSLSDKINNVALSKEDILAEKSSFDNDLQGYISDLDFFQNAIAKNTLPKDTLLKAEQLFEASYEQDGSLLFYNLNELLIYVNESALSSLKENYLPQLPSIYSGQTWETDITQVKGLEESFMQKKENYMYEYGSLVGDDYSKVEELYSRYEQLSAVSKELAEEKEKAKEKFKPLDTDDAGTLWGKMIRFNTLKMYDMCIECLQKYQKVTDDKNASVYVPIVMQFYKNIETTGIDYGVIVTNVGDGSNKNTFYHVGDIIISLNQQQVKTIEDYTRIRDSLPQNAKRYVSVLRYNGDHFEKVSGSFDANLNKVYVGDFCEKLD